MASCRSPIATRIAIVAAFISPCATTIWPSSIPASLAARCRKMVHLAIVLASIPLIPVAWFLLVCSHPKMRDFYLILGACEKNCFHMMAPFLVFVFIVTCVTASAQTPAIMITLRCCADNERPLAMGVQFLIMRLLAYIPVRGEIRRITVLQYFRRQCTLEQR